MPRRELADDFMATQLGRWLARMRETVIERLPVPADERELGRQFEVPAAAAAATRSAGAAGRGHPERCFAGRLPGEWALPVRPVPGRRGTVLRHAFAAARGRDAGESGPARTRPSARRERAVGLAADLVP